MTDIKNRLEELRDILKIDEKKSMVAAIEAEMQSSDFWLDEKTAQAKSQELKKLGEEIRKFDDIYEIAQIASPEELAALHAEIAELEIYTYLGGKYDDHNALLNFYAGAGGVDAQDWTEMLFEMYLRWAEQNNLAAQILDRSSGGEAGIKSATLEIAGSYVFGKLKGESGVHRLVRQSPFNAKALRQTSFALVEVLPEIETDREISIDPKDLRVDVFRASGHGGQSVNTTDSAVRLTHLPTGIVVTCQNERSQLQNKENALKVLRSRLAKLMLDQRREKIEEIRGEFAAPEWGNQIRSYVLHPYKLVKDHRTNYESKDPDKVLLGEIDPFIEAELKWQAKLGAGN
ncbi:MAG: peptide chain release factor 2 [Patescibacteria group bacterium]